MTNQPARHPLPAPTRLLFWPVLLGALAAFGLVLFAADLEPRVESDFFFSTDDPQLAESQRIAELFPQSSQLLISAAAPDPFGEETLERIEALSEALLALSGVERVMSLTHGPSNARRVPESPLWSRLLLGTNPNASLLLVELGPEAGRPTVEAVEGLVTERSAPSFSLHLSGVPYVVELIRRHLARDLRVMSLAALLVFGLLVALIYRSFRVVAATLFTCLGSCAACLSVLHLLDKPIGLLTANLITIVFVLTLSHIVFLTAALGRPGNPEEAVGTTFRASFWCMLTTLLGFASLLLASARPMRELGFAGALGSAMALLFAYTLYPGLLGGARPRSGGGGRPFPSGLGTAAVALTALVAAVAAFGLPRINTDPPLLSYFDPESDIRPGLEVIDANGGSSPLTFVLRAADGGTLDRREPLEALGELCEELEKDPAVGTLLGLDLLLEEARTVPLARLFGPSQLISLLESRSFDRVARTFLTEDRQHTLLFLRMRETGRHEGRRRVIERIEERISASGLEIELKGGLYELQARLGALVAQSLVRGLGGLLVLFLLVAAAVGRDPRITLAMVLALVPVPVFLLGLFGLLALPVDIISSPAANVAIALGIDSMIHLVSAVRRHGNPQPLSASFDARPQEPPAGLQRRAPTPWEAARDELWQPITGAAVILAGGFGIFTLSSFPPTARFGLAVALGTLAAAWSALVVLPRLARR